MCGQEIDVKILIRFKFMISIRICPLRTKPLNKGGLFKCLDKYFELTIVRISSKSSRSYCSEHANLNNSKLNNIELQQYHNTCS